MDTCFSLSENERLHRHCIEINVKHDMCLKKEVIQQFTCQCFLFLCFLTERFNVWSEARIYLVC